MGELLQIHAPHFTAGLVVGVEAAPIIRYMRTWPVPRIVAYCRAKGWRVYELQDRVAVRL